MNIDDLKTLVELVSDRDIAELELEDAGVKLKIRKATLGPASVSASAGVAAPLLAVPSMNPGAALSPNPTPTPNPNPSSTTTTAGSGAEHDPHEDDALRYVSSPMVGTFYRQPEPGAEPFAREGDTIRMGQVLCIIEAMKLMNEIESEFHGELVKVLVENGQSVQYGDALFAIREI